MPPFRSHSRTPFAHRAGFQNGGWQEQRITYEKKLADLEERLQSARGKFPLVNNWREELVVYQGEFAAHAGSLWQASRDTAQKPGGEDWVLVASAGVDGRASTIRGAFDVRKTYAQDDIVHFDGASFIACKDAPGICPGSGWQSLAARGARGPPAAMSVRTLLDG